MNDKEKKDCDTVDVDMETEKIDEMFTSIVEENEANETSSHLLLHTALVVDIEEDKNESKTEHKNDHKQKIDEYTKKAGILFTKFKARSSVTMKKAKVLLTAMGVKIGAFTKMAIVNIKKYAKLIAKACKKGLKKAKAWIIRFYGWLKSKVQQPIVEGEIRKYKLYFVSDMEEEAKYLHKMSTQGYHFNRKWGIEYIFNQEESKNYYYHLGYYEKDKRDGLSYIDNYISAGWENIFHEKGEFDGVWNYFRTEVEMDAAEPIIFSDRMSRIALYKRLLTSWRSLLAMILICMGCMILVLYFLQSKASLINPIIIGVSIFVIILMIVIFAIYSRIYLKIKKKLAEFNK